MNSGIYIRVNTQNILLENLCKEDRDNWLKELEKEGLIRTINVLCNVINQSKEDQNNV